MEKTEAKFQIQDLIPIGVVFVILGLVLTFGADIQQETMDDQVTGLAGCNATVKTACPESYTIADSSLDATATLAEKQGTIAMVVAAAVIIGILIVYFYRKLI